MRRRDRAVVLRRIPYRESSLVVHLLTGEQGLVGLVVRGARRAKGESRAALAGYHTVELFWSERTQGGLGSLLGVELITPRHRLGAGRLAPLAGQLLQEVLHRHLGFGDPQPGLFTLLEAALDLMEQGAPPVPVVGATLPRMLAELGWGWRVDRCAGCADDVNLVYFSVKFGQPVCARCGAPYAAHLFTLTPAQREIVKQLAWPPPFEILSPAEWEGLLRMACATLARHGGKPLFALEPLLAAAAAAPHQP